MAEGCLLVWSTAWWLTIPFRLPACPGLVHGWCHSRAHIPGVECEGTRVSQGDLEKRASLLHFCAQLQNPVDGSHWKSSLRRSCLAYQLSFELGGPGGCRALGWLSLIGDSFYIFIQEYAEVNSRKPLFVSKITETDRRPLFCNGASGRFLPKPNEKIEIKDGSCVRRLRAPCPRQSPP